MKNKFLILAIATMFVAAACNKTQNTNPPPPAAQNTDNQNKQTSMTVQLKEQNGSKENGTAVLTAVDNHTQVKIDVSNGPANPSQPSHIHMGACPTPGGVKYTLNDVVAGQSTTVIDIKLDDLLTQLPLAINIHKSAAAIGTYVACGDVGTQTSTTPTPTATPAAKTVTINMTSSGFSPATITINKGDTVTFVNQDTKSRWPASAPHPTHTDYPEFDAKMGIVAGGSWSFTFTKTGTWKFHDHLNPSQFGSVTVK